jgi:hypothetical protein
MSLLNFRFFSWIAAVMFVSFLGCSERVNETKSIPILDSLDLAIVKEVKFHIDTSTNSSISSITTYPRVNPKYFIIYHTFQSSASIFDLQTRKLLKKISFPIEGPNGVGEGIRGMYFHNFDSIFLIAILEQRIFMVDSAARLKKKFNLANDKVYAMTGTTYSTHIKNGLMYLTGYPVSQQAVNSSDFSDLILNLSNGHLISRFNLSKEYDRGFWGYHNYMRIKSSFDAEGDNLIFSFPNDDYVYVRQADDSIRKYFAGSSKFRKLKPLASRYFEDNEKIYKHAANQGSYSGIFYDRWSKLFYRVGFNPINKEYESPADTQHNPSLIILNKNFLKVGEWSLQSGEYDMSSIFLTHEGLHIFNQKKYSLDEDNLTFDVFRPRKK